MEHVISKQYGVINTKMSFTMPVVANDDFHVAARRLTLHQKLEEN